VEAEGKIKTSPAKEDLTGDYLYKKLIAYL
jgi:hypothetical protein